MRTHSLLVEFTLPTIAVVVVGTLVSAQWLSTTFEETHQRSAEARVHRLSDQVEVAFARGGLHGHRDIDGILRVVSAASGKSVVVALPDGTGRYASNPELLSSRVTLPPRVEPIVIHGDTRYSRHVRELRHAARCQGCHDATRPLGWLAIDSPTANLQREIDDQARLNLYAGLILAGALSIMLGGIQILLLIRPIRRLTHLVTQLRDGKFEARATIDRPDEIGDLTVAVNDLANVLQNARTELDRTHRAELGQAEKLASLGELTSTIAHEIKNPLAGIIGALRVLVAEADPAAPNTEVLSKVLAQAERLSHTAVELLDFARPLRPSVHEVDVCELLDRTLFFIERQAAEQKVELRRHYSPGLPAAAVDPDLMKQVLLNILLNGLQAMPSGGALDLTVQVGGESSVQVTISDQGVGISPEHLPRLFSPFFTTKASGTGLGLYVSKQLMETQRGEIRVESRLGHGTSFTLRMPAVAAAADKEELTHDAS